MAYIMVDIEADGPIPSDYSMISFAAVVVKSGLEQSFYATLKPISDNWLPNALKVSGYSREETLKFPEPLIAMQDFTRWLTDEVKERPYFISDNNGFDWQFINWYFHHFLNHNPFGHSSTNLGSLYKGIVKDMFKDFKHLRQTEHTHHPLDDAKGNAEALLTIKEQYGLKIRF
jgi:DNA polymerase III alpha subunit (gram-positive type)